MRTKNKRPPNYYGEPHKFDPFFRGPVKRRSCTDVLCCLMFIFTIFFYIILGTVAWLHGDPRKVIHPTDSFGIFCGQPRSPNEDKPFLFYFNFLHCANPSVLINFHCPTTQLCVSRCPDRFASYADLKSNFNQSYWDYYKQFCRPGIKDPSKSVNEILVDEDCPSILFPSRPFLHRCFPDFMVQNESLTVGDKTTFTDALGKTKNMSDLELATNDLKELLEKDHFSIKIFEDIGNSWFWILMYLVITMVISLLFILMLRMMSGVLLWTVIVGVSICLAYGIWHCYWEYSRLKQLPSSGVTLSGYGLQSDIRVYTQLNETWLILMIVLVVFLAVILIVMFCLRKKIRISIALLEEGSRAISFVMSTLFYPIVTFALLTVCITYWASVAIFLVSSNDAVYKVIAQNNSCEHANMTCNPETFNLNGSGACSGAQCTFAFYGGESMFHNHILALQLLNLFVFLWLAHFVTALGQISLAGAFASYYWALRKPADIPAFPLATSFGRALRYHTGTLALGAMIISIVQFFRILLEYLDQKLKGAQNGISRFLLSCLKCCFWCLEHFIRFMNRNAYIMVAIYGKNFFTSAKDAVFLIMRNLLRVAVLDKVTDFLLFLGKILITGGVGAMAFFFFSNQMPGMKEKVPLLNYYWVPVVVVILGSYLVAHGFFSVYAMCVDTLFLCFLMDLEKNNGTVARPYFMSTTLRSILNKKNPKTP